MRIPKLLTAKIIIDTQRNNIIDIGTNFLLLGLSSKILKISNPVNTAKGFIQLVLKDIPPARHIKRPIIKGVKQQIRINLLGFFLILKSEKKAGT